MSDRTCHNRIRAKSPFVYGCGGLRLSSGWTWHTHCSRARDSRGRQMIWPFGAARQELPWADADAHRGRHDAARIIASTRPTKRRTAREPSEEDEDKVGTHDAAKVGGRAGAKRDG